MPEQNDFYTLLNNMIKGDNYSGLTRIVRVLHLARVPASVGKSEMLLLLHNFYDKPDCIKNIYESLSPYEKELLKSIVYCKCTIDEEVLEEIAMRFHFKQDKKSNLYGRYYKSFEFFPKDSKLYAIFPDTVVTKHIQTALEHIIPPFIPKFDPTEVIKCDCEIIGREKRYRDFDLLLSYINSQYVAATRPDNLLSKSAVLKYQKKAGYTEVLQEKDMQIGDIRGARDTTVFYGLIKLLLCADIIDNQSGYFVLSKNCDDFIAMNLPDKACFLFANYTHHRNETIDECERISTCTFRTTRSNVDLSKPRNVIIDLLKICPINVWIDAKEFRTTLRKLHRNLFFDVLGGIRIEDRHSPRHYQRPSWDEFEACAIDVVLMEYLAVLGALDVQIDYYHNDDFSIDHIPRVIYFKITELGAFLFGLTDRYTAEVEAYNNENGFLVQPNFDVVIVNSNERLKHELFFDRFAERSTSDAEVSVYRLDFKTMVNALTNHITIRSILDYCSANASAEIPSNVITAFEEWETQSKRIRIRNAMILETDDEYLIKELISYRGMPALTEGKVLSAVVVPAGNERKVKALIEKNKRFCVFE